MPRIDDLFARMTDDVAVDADALVARAMAKIEGAPSPRAAAQAERRQIAVACLSAAILVGGGGGLAVGAQRLDESPLSPTYALSPAALLKDG